MALPAVRRLPTRERYLPGDPSALPLDRHPGRCLFGALRPVERCGDPGLHRFGSALEHFEGPEGVDAFGVGLRSGVLGEGLGPGLDVVGLHVTSRAESPCSNVCSIVRHHAAGCKGGVGRVSLSTTRVSRLVAGGLAPQPPSGPDHPRPARATTRVERDRAQRPGRALEPCGTDPVTGFYRDGNCSCGPDDVGLHAVCAVVTSEFLEHQQSVGNDLSTPRPGVELRRPQPRRPLVRRGRPVAASTKGRRGRPDRARLHQRARARADPDRGHARARGGRTSGSQLPRLTSGVHRITHLDPSKMRVKPDATETAAKLPSEPWTNTTGRNRRHRRRPGRSLHRLPPQAAGPGVRDPRRGATDRRPVASAVGHPQALLPRAVRRPARAAVPGEEVVVPRQGGGGQLPRVVRRGVRPADRPRHPGGAPGPNSPRRLRRHHLHRHLHLRQRRGATGTFGKHAQRARLRHRPRPVRSCSCTRASTGAPRSSAKVRCWWSAHPTPAPTSPTRSRTATRRSWPVVTAARSRSGSRPRRCTWSSRS